MNTSPRTPWGGVVQVPRMAWAFILLLAAASVVIFAVLFRFYTPIGSPEGVFTFIAAGLTFAVLLLAGVVVLHTHYRRTKEHLGELLEDAEEHARIEQATGDIILSLNKVVSAQADEEHRLNTELRGLFLETVRGLIATLEARDEYTQNHSLRVAGWSTLLARYTGVCESDIETLERAALLHDIGKLGLPDEILLKPGQLTADEFAIVMEHPERGEAIVKNIQLLSPTRGVIRHHHERIDGGGYPDGITDPPQLVKIICIADCFDAMTSNRPYRSPMEYMVAKEKMLEVAGTQLDEGLVRSFFELLETTGEGYRSIYHVEGIPEPNYSEENELRLEKRNDKEEVTE